MTWQRQLVLQTIRTVRCGSWIRPPTRSGSVIALPDGPFLVGGHASAFPLPVTVICAPLIGDRRTKPGDDLVGALVAARDAGDDRLSDEELLANLILLLVAGFETT